MTVSSSSAPRASASNPFDVRIDVHLTESDRMALLRRDVAQGFARRPPVIPPKWFYDARGSALFEEITRLPEYYLTRAERRILGPRADEIARRAGADTLVELGSGASEKTRLLLHAMARAGRLSRYVPFDVCEPLLREAGAAIGEAYGIEVHGVVGDFERHLAELPRGGRRLVAFLGSTIGNLPPVERGAFLGAVAAGLAPGDSFLLGTDLVKEPARLVAAYDDAQGVTAEFNRNVLRVLDRELGADFDPEAFAHLARWDAAREWIEMRLVALRDMEVEIPGLARLRFAAGDEILTEICAKFRREPLSDELRAAGFAELAWWTDPEGDFALSLWRRA